MAIKKSKNSIYKSKNRIYIQSDFIYITQYATTKGILSLTAKGFYHTSDNLVFCGHPYSTGFTWGKEAFGTLEEAQVNCEKRRIKAIKSAQAKLVKLGAMLFTNSTPHPMTRS